MAKGRNLKPSILRDEDVFTMSWIARYVWTYLPCFADREGRLVDKPLSLRIDMLPNDHDVDMDKVLQELTDKKFLIRYSVGDKKYIQIRNFLKHQKPFISEPQSIIPPVGYIPTNNVDHRSTFDRVERDSNSVPDPKSLISLSTYQPITLSTHLPEEGSSNFNNQSFALLFGEWPPAENPKYNESRARAEIAFFENINSENYDAFVSAWNIQLDLYKKDKSKDRRKYLGSFRTFCEGRWMNVGNVANYKEPSKNTKIDENFADIN